VAEATRGEFLSLTTVGLGAVIGGVIGVPATAYLLAPVTKEVSFDPVFLGDVTKFKAEQQFSPTAATYVEDPKNPQTSPGLAWVHYTGKSNADWHAEDAMFVVFSNRCMHLGCPIAATPQGFACPCHGGQYDFEGRRTAGPPVRPLNRYDTKVVNGHLILGELMAVTSVDQNGTAHTEQLKGPGQPTEGILSFLYPDAPQQ
jgi:menaquinol-cytochrome c reductase iron-sulfur subunit